MFEDLINNIKMFFCRHDWEYLNAGGLWQNGGKRIGNQLVYRCKKCGKVETRFDYFN